ncbi:putative holin [Rheinheimera maricola]|uniref:Holin n=1 Tax=Rheinheimera maricola TaxID=2793282 RepID=A0ABS7X6K2_9GAMM|nr:putative holin [Rheinheimera maricola]MBZ9610790.1 putative holin [Rheinheimera maricola]
MPARRTFALPRLTLWAIVAVILLFAIAMVSPQQLPVVLYKLALVTLASVLGYWVDRSLFPYDRPHTYAETGEDLMPRGLAMLRRALIVLACVLGLTLGL